MGEVVPIRPRNRWQRSSNIQLLMLKARYLEDHNLVPDDLQAELDYRHWWRQTTGNWYDVPPTPGGYEDEDDPPPTPAPAS